MMVRFWRKLRNHEIGATAVEYGLIAGLISVVIITAIKLVNSSLTNVFYYISSNLTVAL